MDVVNLNISMLKTNPNNPRVIRDDKFDKLVNSLTEFPEMLEARPVVCNKDMIVLGGNMRLKAAKAAGMKTLPVMIAETWTEQQEREFIIKDNVSGGEWDFDMLANEWDAQELEDWGLDVPNFETDEDYSGKNQEIDVDSYDDEMVIKLKYTEEEYLKVREQLSKIAETPEQAVWKLLGNE